MKHELTAKRLTKALNDTGLIPQELSIKSGVSKSSISQYINGSHKPSNISAGKMGDVLNVDPMWLMGFDVPMKKAREEDISDIMADLLLEDKYILEVSSSMKRLNEQSKKRLLRYIDLLIEEQENG